MRKAALAFSVLLALAGSAWATPEKISRREAPIFIRIQEENGQVSTLQTAVAHYRSPSATVEVDLVGAIHIADAKYFTELDALFAKYDVVLYELVAPPDKLIPDRKAKSDNPLGMLQELMTDVLGLEHQLQGIDYNAKNFVHADLSPEGMQAALEKRGETPISIMLGVAADVMRSSTLAASGSSSSSSSAQPGASDPDEFDKFVEMATDPDGSRKMKQSLARQFASSEAMASMPKAMEASLIQDRNAAAMQVFDEKLKRLQASRPDSRPLRIAIFYGAAHLPDFHRRLLADYPFTPTGVDWVTAWDMRTPETASPAVRFLYNSLGDVFQELMKQP